jgi:hypothetical protein
MGFITVVGAVKNDPACDVSFNDLYKRFAVFIRRTALNWSANPKVARLYLVDDLENIFIAKLLEVALEFRLPAGKSDQECERLFAGMLGRSLKNKAIDLDWHSTRPKRQPDLPILGLTMGDKEAHERQVPAPTNYDIDYDRMVGVVASRLTGDARTVFLARVRGHKDKSINTLYGIKPYRVANLIKGPIHEVCERVIGKVIVLDN